MTSCAAGCTELLYASLGTFSVLGVGMEGVPAGHAAQGSVPGARCESMRLYPEDEMRRLQGSR